MKRILLMLIVILVLFCNTAYAELWGSGSASTLIVQDAGDENATYYLGLWRAVAGALIGKTDTGITYNPSTNLFTIGGNVNIVGDSLILRGGFGGGGYDQAKGFFFGDGDTGFYEAADDVMYYVIGGQKKWKYQGNLMIGIQSGMKITCGNGTSSTIPRYSFFEDDDTGIGTHVADGVNIIGNGTELATFDTTSIELKKPTNIGDDTNETQFASDGYRTMVADARVKKIIVLNSARSQVAGPGVPPPSAAFGNFVGLEFDINDKAYYDWEVPYECDPSEDIDIEVHWFIDEAQDDPGGANEEQIQWRASWTAVKENGTEAVDGATENEDTGDIAILGTAKFLVQSNCGPIQSAQYDQDDVIGICIERIDVTKDDPTNDPILLSIEIEFTVNKDGEHL